MSTKNDKKILKPRITSITKIYQDVDLKPLNDTDSNLTPKVTRSWFYANELASIYNFPSPTFTNNLNIAVVSFGGGLYGTYDQVTGILTILSSNDLCFHSSRLSVGKEAIIAFGTGI